MQKFIHSKGIVAALDQANIDTDQIIPKQYLKSIKRTGFGLTLFDDWRYLDHGEPGMDHSKRQINPNFVLNQPRYKGARILLTRENFGCGSSREHAPWALLEYGFNCVIAPSFADIFLNNCFKNSLLPVTLAHAIIDEMFEEVLSSEGAQFEVDLTAQSVTTDSGKVFQFEIEPMQKHRMLEGLDDIGITLQQSEKIKAYEHNQKNITPWIFN